MAKKSEDTRTTLARALDALSGSGHGSAASALAELVHTVRALLVTPPGPPEHVRDKLSAALQRLGELPTPEEVLACQAAQYTPPPPTPGEARTQPVRFHTLAVGGLFRMRGSPLVWQKTSPGMRRPAYHAGGEARIAATSLVYPHHEAPKPIPMSAAESRTAPPKKLQFCDLRVSDQFYVREDHSGGVYRKCGASAAEKPGGGTTKMGARTHVYRVPEPAPNLAAEAMRDNPPPTPPAAFVAACAAAVRESLPDVEAPAPQPGLPDEPIVLTMVRTAVEVYVREFNRDHPAANYTPADAVGEFACAILGPAGLASLIASLANSLAHGRRSEVPAS